MDLSTNPLAILTFLSTPAVLTNASCVLLFGTGNRYGRAIDRMHALADGVRSWNGSESDFEKRLKLDQLQAGEHRTALIVRALTCFYAAVACFTASTLLCLIGMAVRTAAGNPYFQALFVFAFVVGASGILAIITGAALLVRESWFSYRILQAEREFLDMLNLIQERK